MSLTHPNVFSTKMNKLDNSLFLVKPEGKFDSYSRSCPWNFRKQPVILTDKEKKDIDEKHPGSYDQAVKYGSDPKNQYWYICPRYWSLKDNVSLTDAEAKSGKYGDIIPKDAKKFLRAEIFLSLLRINITQMIKANMLNTILDS